MPALPEEVAEERKIAAQRMQPIALCEEAEIGQARRSREKGH
jgi:hypothetical protein